MVLWLIDDARAEGLPYIYLGYWIAESEKMSYKTRFRPLEALGSTGWQRFELMTFVARLASRNKTERAP